MDLNPEEAKRRSRGYSRDMSPEAVDRGLRLVSEMNDLPGIWPRQRSSGR
jgi:hypothetical protein